VNGTTLVKIKTLEDEMKKREKHVKKEVRFLETDKSKV
jgi:hypothetical protein